MDLRADPAPLDTGLGGPSCGGAPWMSVGASVYTADYLDTVAAELCCDDRQDPPIHVWDHRVVMAVTRRREWRRRR
jgi:hypothetical protein